jgi:hypothetical protein
MKPNIKIKKRQRKSGERGTARAFDNPSVGRIRQNVVFNLILLDSWHSPRRTIRRNTKGDSGDIRD